MKQLFSIIGWIGTAIVGVAVAVRVLNWVGAITIAPEQDRYVVWAAWTGLACVLLYTAGQWRDIVDYFRRRQARYGAIATVGVLVALVIVVIVNYLSTQTNRRWDLTENRQNSLSEQTVRVLQDLDAPVKFTVFDQQVNFDRYRTRMDAYAYNSRQVSVEYVDPDSRPVVAREYDIDAYGTIVVEYMGRRERVTSDEEQDITNALIKAISGEERTVYFVQGHGEKDPENSERDGYRAVADTLRRDNYTVEKLVLAQQRDVPENATALIVAGPTSDLLPEEADAIRRYLDRGGKLMVLVDPQVGDQAAPMPNLTALLQEWNIELGANVVVDVSGATTEPSIAVAASYPTHPITDRFATLTLYPLARSVNITSTNIGRTALPVVQTSVRSWAESNLASLSGEVPVELQPESGDLAGPVTIAAAVSAPVETPEPAENQEQAEGGDTDADAPRRETRVVVFGDSDFPTNAYAGLIGNPNLFANAVNWLAQQENLIAIRPAAAADRRVTLTAAQQQMVFLTSVVIIPLAVFGLGIFTWWRRR